MTEKIALLADSACDLPRDIVEKMAIKILPLKIIYPEGEFSDRVDIQPNDVYNRMPGEIPTTAMPCLGEIKSLFETIKSQGFTHVIAVALSSGLSGTYGAIKLAAQDINDMVVKTFDSRTLSMGTGWMVLDAARNITNGLSFDKVMENIAHIQPKVKVYYVVETLEYLRKGGRIGQVSAMLGEFLHFKPIISVNPEGKYFTFCKVRGRRKSIDRLIEIVENIPRDKMINLAVMHGGAKKEAEHMLERLSKLPNIKELIFSDISPALGVHTGPGLLGVSFHEV
ncbi:DegV [Syntrophomonas zehnderi OL-4]|uniref:DegV n=1 Tax=Syntrophomonas zehnderi OL-4 TaxID=690567 RepID=A0A0E4C927_9FIRM|nr:DegV [Syntrophomonas zehnderi OL-4]